MGFGVIDAGATGTGRPYFVMELVRGIPITEYCDRNRLSIADRLDLFVLVCQAVQQAHLKGIIHRDLKPSNVLITLHDGTPVPKVIDFGIAKATGQQTLTDKTLYTGFAELLGTPMYLSPEQAELSGIDVDTRSDIYSLGVLLYELLTGTTPFDHATFRKAALDEVRRIIREEEPPPPSSRCRSLPQTESATPPNRQTDARKLNRALRGELDWITMKALEKDRRRRYETAGAFAADIARYRRHEPVEAGPPSAWYRGRKFVRRHRLALMMTAIVTLSLAVVGGMWADSTARVERARRAAAESRAEVQRRANEARRHRYVIDVRHAHELAQVGEAPRALELLNKWLPGAGEQDVRNFAWYYVLRLCHDEKKTLRGHAGAVYHAEFSPDGRKLASCGQDGTVRLWELATGRCLRKIAAHPAEVNDAAFAPDGRTLATVSDDGTIKLWNLESGSDEPKATIPAHKGDAIAVRFAHDGRQLVSAGRNDGRIKLWDIATRRELAASTTSEGRGVESVALAPDGKALATVCHGCAQLWDLTNLTFEKSLRVYQGPVYGVAFSADGKRLATADASGRVRMWDCKSGDEQHDFAFVGVSGARNDAQAVVFLAGDRMVLSGDGHAGLRLSDATSGKWLAHLNGHTGKIWGVSASPDGKTFATASSDGTIKLWDAALPQRWRAIPLPVHEGAIAFTPDGQTLIAAQAVGGRPVVAPDGSSTYRDGADLEVRAFDAITGAERFRRLLDSGQEALYSWLVADGTLVGFFEPGGKGTAWQVSTGKRAAAFDRGSPVRGSRFVALLTGDQEELLDAITGERRTLEYPSGTLCIGSGRGGQIIAARHGDQLAIYDLSTNRSRSPIRRVPGGWTAHAAVFSPDAALLAAWVCAGTPRGDIELWDANTLKLIDSLPGHSTPVGDLDFSPDGAVLATGAQFDVRLWDVAAHEELLTFRGFQGCYPVRFAPDGRTLAFRAIAGDGKAWVYLVTTALPEE
jgi:WD40 repeat protein